jgi:hypothetical protein
VYRRAAAGVTPMRILLGLLLLLCAFSCVAHEEQEPFLPGFKAPDNKPVILGPGDVLGIVICQDLACQHQQGCSTVTVDRNGNIHLPWVRTVKASGLSAVQLQRSLTERLKHRARRVSVVPVQTTVTTPPIIDVPSPDALRPLKSVGN